MSLLPPGEVTRVGVVGAGVIGTGWISHFLRMGYEVHAFDPAPAARDRLAAEVDAIWPAVEELGLAPGASRERLHVVDSLAQAVNGVDVVQEAVPEVLDLKVDLFRQMDALAPENTVLLSSTSGLTITEIQRGCEHPERTAIGHPFNPPYLIPLVEVIGGENTAKETVDWAVEFYDRTGKHAMRLEREVPALIGSRLQEAMWREALHMIEAGEATVEQIDASITEGPGLRWAITGPVMNFHLSGGETGLRHVLDHFGPTLKEPWTRLVAPELTPELKKRLVEGCEAEAGDRTVSEMVAERDRCLIAILRAKEECRGQVG